MNWSVGTVMSSVATEDVQSTVNATQSAECWPASATTSQALQTSIKRHSRPLIYSCWHRHWRRSADLHLSITDLCQRWRPGILEFHISFPITGTTCTRFTGRSYLKRVFSVCCHLTSGKRNRLCKKLPTQRFWKWTISFTIDCIWLSNIALRTYTAETGTEKQQMKYHCIGAMIWKHDVIHKTRSA